MIPTLLINRKKKWKLEPDYFLGSHNGARWKVKWAHPDQGNIIATCSYDKTIIIWEERKQKDNSSNTNKSNVWCQRLTIQGKNESVEDIKFAPKFKGLILEAAFENGKVITHWVCKLVTFFT